MTDLPAVDPAARRKALLLGVAGPIAMLLMVWTLFAVNVLFGIDLLTYFKHRENNEATSPRVVFYMALGFTPLFLGYAWYCGQKALALFDHGVEVQGRIISVGKFSRHGMVPLRYSYMYKNKAYSGAADVLTARGRELHEQGTVPLIVNSRKPSQSDLYESVFPKPKA